MAEANGIFVHLFRNKKAWKQNEGLFETAKGKFQVEKEHRLKLAQELGIKRLNELPSLLSNIDPDVIFSKIKCDELQAVRRIIDCGSDVFWPQLDSKRDGSGCKYNGCIPTEILDEASFVTSLGMFSDIYIVSNKPDTTNFLVGRRNKNNYLIAYWGPQEVYEKAQAEFVRIAEIKKAVEAARLAEAEAAKLKEERAKANNEKNSGSWGTRHKWSPSEWLVTWMTTLSLISFINWEFYKMVRDEEVYNQAKVGDIVEEKKKEEKQERAVSDACSTCEIKPTDSVYKLPDGEVFEKTVNLCPRGTAHYILTHYYLQTSFYERSRNTTIVIKDVFNKVKVGDKIPFKRPEY